MAHPTIENWLNSAVGRRMDPDGHYGLQCVDAVDQYGQDIFGVPWQQCVGGVRGAKDLLAIAPAVYWHKTYNDPKNPHQVPSRGDVGVSGGDAFNEFGHTWIVLEANQSGMWVVQQDGFAAPHVWTNGNWYSNKPAHKVWLSYSQVGMGTVTGWLSPRVEKLQGYIAPQSSVIEQPKEWDELASKEDFKAAIREVLAEGPVLDAIALAILKRPCYLIDPVSGQINGTTTLATKINWMAHNDAQILGAIVDVSKKLEVANPTLPAETSVQSATVPEGDEK